MDISIAQDGDLRDLCHSFLRASFLNGSFVAFRSTYFSFEKWAQWICETWAILAWLPFEASCNSVIAWIEFLSHSGRIIRDRLMLFDLPDNLYLSDQCLLFR
jgi:hypothetical protein